MTPKFNCDNGGSYGPEKLKELLDAFNDDYFHDNYVGDDDCDDEIVDDIDPENSSCHQHLLPSKIL